jgi:hypothetical protein
VAASPERHHHAAARHESAAATHDRSARFWDKEGDIARADLHRAAAAHEREGGALQRRWAELIELNARGGGGVPERSLRVPSTGSDERDAETQSREIDLEVWESELRARLESAVERA